MRRPFFRFALPALLLPLASASSGGWAVVTVHELPDYLVVGEPVDITFSIRAHGVTPMTDRAPSVQLGSEGSSVAARPTLAPGVYKATVTPAAAGTTRLVIDPDYGISVRLLPMEVLASSNGHAFVLEPAERGRRLFVAKGCAMCHRHADASLDWNVPIGPELTDRAYNRGILRRVLTDPAGILESTGGFPMPRLELTDAEIDALSAFING